MQGQAAASASATTANAGQTQKELLMQHEMFMKPRVAGLTNLERRTLELWMSSQKDAYNELKNKIQTEGGSKILRKMFHFECRMKKDLCYLYNTIDGESIFLLFIY